MSQQTAYRICPTCRTIYPVDAPLSCARDGARLQDDPRILAGKFILLRRLGAGGMGEVWEAEQPAMGRTVAVKLLLPAVARDAGYLRRFEREARAAGQLIHPNIVTLHETGRDGDRCYLAMEFLTGETLTRFLEREKRLPLKRALMVWRPVAEAMSVAHRRGVVHRDLKPENIFLSLPVTNGPIDLQVKVLDFGIAKLLGGPAQDNATMAGMSMGTPTHMAPEQFGAAAEATDRADVFALGVILYEMLAGQRPYVGTSIALAGSRPAPLRQFAPEAPAEIEALIERMLAFQAADRPSVDEVLAALPVPKPAMVLSQRQRRLVFGGVGVAVMLAGIGLYAALSNRDPMLAGDVAGQREQALRVLRDGLGATDGPLRAVAARAIGQGRDPQLRALLAPRLDDPDAEVRAEAAVGLGQLGAQHDAAALQKVAERDPVPLTQVAAAGALLRLHQPAGPAVLRQAIAGRDDGARLEAALFLADDGDAAARERLHKWRERRTLPLDTRLSILAALLKGGDPDARQELTGLADAPPGQMGPQQLTAAATLARAGDDHARTLLSMTAGRDGPLRLLAARLLAALGDPSAYELFRTVVQDPRQDLAARELAVEGLAACKRRDGVPALAAALSPRADGHLRIKAAGALLRLAGDDPTGIAAQSLNWARTALGDRNWSVRGDAVSVLGDLDSEEAIALLGQALRDANAEVRRGAARALGRKRVRTALVQLKQGLDDGDADVRRVVMKAVAQVGTYLKGMGDTQTAKAVVARLGMMAKGGDPLDAIVASGTLLTLGDDSQRLALRRGLASADARVRRLALELGGTEPAILVQSLKDTDPEVRFSAARLLAERGQRQGEAVLREALGRGGVEGLTAYGLLRKLGQQVAAPAGLGALLTMGDLPTRTAAAEALGDLPPDEAVPLLRQAVFNSAAVVRRQVAEVAFDLARRGHPAGRQLLNVLVDDADVIVRTRAAALLALLPRMDEPAPKAVVVAPPPDMAQPSPPDMAQPSPPILHNGPLAPAKVPPEQLLKEGEAALAHKDYRKALLLLDQAEALARGPHGGRLRLEIYMKRGHLYETRNRSEQALEEYSKVLLVPPAQRSKAEAAVVASLSKRFGRLVLSRPEGGKCRTLEKWIRPGDSLIDTGGKLQQMRIRAGEVKVVQTCE